MGLPKKYDGGRGGGGGQKIELSPQGGTPICWLYGYVPLERVWYSSHLLWEKGPVIIENWSRLEVSNRKLSVASLHCS